MRLLADPCSNRAEAEGSVGQRDTCRFNRCSQTPKLPREPLSDAVWPRDSGQSASHRPVLTATTEQAWRRSWFACCTGRRGARIPPWAEVSWVAPGRRRDCCVHKSGPPRRSSWARGAHRVGDSCVAGWMLAGPSAASTEALAADSRRDWSAAPESDLPRRLTGAPLRRPRGGTRCREQAVKDGDRGWRDQPGSCSAGVLRSPS